MVALPWSHDEISKLTRYYGRVKPQLLAESFDGRSVGAVKDRILHFQKSGILPEINPWTLEEALFLCDVHRLYSLEELHIYLQHPKWSVQRRLSIITDGSQVLSNAPWSAIEERFVVDNLTHLSIKEISVYLGRSDADVKARVDSLYALGRVNVTSTKLKDFFYQDTPKWGMRSCTKCNANIKIRFNEHRIPDHLFCSMKCKFALPSTKKSFMYLLLDEKRTMKDIARFLKITEAKANTLMNLYFPDRLPTIKNPKVVATTPSQRSGKREDLNGIYMRSGWEANVARILNKKKKKWEYEPKTFVFKNIKRGSVTYTPDFYVKSLEGRKDVWIEVKGKMNTGDYTKLLNFKRGYPAEFAKLRGIVAKNSKAEESFKRLGIPILWYYNDLRKEFAGTITRWEGR